MAVVKRSPLWSMYGCFVCLEEISGRCREVAVTFNCIIFVMTLKKPSDSKWLQKKGSSKSLRGVMCLNTERSHK